MTNMLATYMKNTGFQSKTDYSQYYAYCTKTVTSNFHPEDDRNVKMQTDHYEVTYKAVHLLLYSQLRL